MSLERHATIGKLGPLFAARPRPTMRMVTLPAGITRASRSSARFPPRFPSIWAAVACRIAKCVASFARCPKDLPVIKIRSALTTLAIAASLGTPLFGQFLYVASTEFQ